MMVLIITRTAPAMGRLGLPVPVLY